MHTEQDTFDRLRRIPFEQMRSIIRKVNQTSTYHKGAALNALKEKGWTRIDYMSTLDKVVKTEQEEKIAARLAAGQ